MTERRDGCARTEEAVGWALHALEPDEEMAVEHHIPTCADCQAAVHDTDMVMTHLASAVEMVDPPPRLRDRILDVTASIPQVPQQRSAPSAWESPSARPTPSAPPSGPRSDPGPGRPAGAPPAATGPGRRPARPRRLVAIAAAVAAVIVVGGLGARTVQLQQQVDAANVQAARAQTQAANVAAQAGNTNQLVRLLATPNVSHAFLTRTDGTGGTAVAAIVLENGQRDVYTLGLTANATDHTYVLWGLKNAKAKPQPLGAFDVAAQDAGRRVVGASTQDDYGVYAISLEPGRTPPTTPTDVVAAGQLST